MLFEEKSQKSSFPLISSALSTEFVHAHLQISDKQCARYCFGLPVELMQEPIHLAIAHGCLRYVEDYLSVEGGDISREAPNAGRVTIWCASRDLHTTNITRVVECDRILAVVLKHHPLVEDDDLIAALLGGSPAALRTLLHYRSPGKLHLRCPTNYPGGHVWEKGEQYGPLYIVGERGSPERGSSDPETEAIIDLLLERGEDINDLCGPLGTVLHSYLQQDEYMTNYNYKFTELLIEKGLDINRSGPQGNALEYLWQVANERAENLLAGHQALRLTICHLIDLGSVNRRQGPNPELMSKHRMTSVRRLLKLSWERFYTYILPPVSTHLMM